MKYDDLHAEMVAAMKARDKVRRDTIRLVIGELKNEAPRLDHELTEADVDAMIKRTIKQTSETLEMSRKAGNDADRTALLEQQVEILEGLLPEQVSGEALVALIERVIAETGASSKKDMGRVMGALNAATGGNFDKPAAAKEVGARLS